MQHLSHELMVVVAGLLFLAFVWIACVMMPRRTPWKEGELCDYDDCLVEQYQPKPVPESHVQVYVMLCISTENTLRAVLPRTKALLAEIPVGDYQWAEARADFASQIVDGLSNACGLNVEPILYSTPLAHNLIPVINGQHAVLSMHNLVKRRLEARRQPF